MENLKEMIEDKSVTWAFVSTFAIVIVCSWIVGAVLGIDRGFAVVGGCIVYIIYIMATYSQAEAEAKAFDGEALQMQLEASVAGIEKLESALNKAKIEAQQALGEAQQAAATANAYQSQATAGSAEIERLRNVEQLLRKQMQSLGDDLANAKQSSESVMQSAEAEMQSLRNELANAQQALATAKQSQELAVANAIANAKKQAEKEYAPTVKVAEAYKEYALKMGITNSSAMKSAIGEENVQLVKDERERAKRTLDEFIELHKASFEKQVEQRFGIALKETRG